MTILNDTFHVNILNDPFDKKRDWSLFYGIGIPVYRNKRDAIIERNRVYKEHKSMNNKWTRKCFNTIKVVGVEIDLGGLNVLTKRGIGWE